MSEYSAFMFQLLELAQDTPLLVGNLCAEQDIATFMSQFTPTKWQDWKIMLLINFIMTD